MCDRHVSAPLSPNIHCSSSKPLLLRPLSGLQRFLLTIQFGLGLCIPITFFVPIGFLATLLLLRYRLLSSRRVDDQPGCHFVLRMVSCRTEITFYKMARDLKAMDRLQQAFSTGIQPEARELQMRTVHCLGVLNLEPQGNNSLNSTIVYAPASAT